jgi:hypothetical protein
MTSDGVHASIAPKQFACKVVISIPANATPTLAVKAAIHLFLLGRTFSHNHFNHPTHNISLINECPCWRASQSANNLRARYGKRRPRQGRRTPKKNQPDDLIWPRGTDRVASTWCRGSRLSETAEALARPGHPLPPSVGSRPSCNRAKNLPLKFARSPRPLRQSAGVVCASGQRAQANPPSVRHNGVPTRRSPLLV